MPATIDPKDYDLPAQPTTADILRSLPFALRFAREAAPWAFWVQSLGAIPLAIATAVGTVAVKRVGDAVFATDAGSAFAWSAALVGAVAAVAFVRFLKMRAGETLRHRLQLAAEEKQMAHLMSVSAEVAESSWFQRLASQYRDKAWRINGISWQIPNIVEDVAVLLGASTVFAFVPWPAGVAVVAAAVLRFFLARGETAWEWDVFDFEKRDGRRAKYLSHVLTRPEHRPALFAYQMAEPFFARWKALASAVLEKRLQGVGRFARSLFVSDLLEAVGLALGLAVAVGGVFDGRTTAGAAVAFLVGYQRVWGAMANTTEHARMFLIDGVFLPVFEMFFRVPHEAGSGTPLPSGRLRIVFDDVWFKYPEGSAWVLKGVSFAFDEGDHLALIGLNGAGKSTLLKLLSGVHRPTRGRILVNGVDAADIDPSAWRAAFAVMAQDVPRYSDALEAQIHYGDLSRPLDAERLELAVTASGFDRMADEFAHGVGTWTGKEFAMPEDDAIELSGGQNQLLGVARTLYRPARVYVFDEPTSAVDAQKEEHFFAAIPDALAGKAVVFVSHRFSTLRRASRILVLDDGTIIEDGSHEELVACKGRYAELFALQAKMYL